MDRLLLFYSHYLALYVHNCKSTSITNLIRTATVEGIKHLEYHDTKISIFENAGLFWVFANQVTYTNTCIHIIMYKHMQVLTYYTYKHTKRQVPTCMHNMNNTTSIPLLLVHSMLGRLQ